MHQDGEILLHRTMQTSPDMFLKAIAPSREDLVVAVACLFPWDWLADLCAQAQMPCVLGPALSLQAIHGGKAKNDKIDAQKIAVLLRSYAASHISDRAKTAHVRRARPLDALCGCQRPNHGCTWHCALLSPSWQGFERVLPPTHSPHAQGAMMTVPL